MVTKAEREVDVELLDEDDYEYLLCDGFKGTCGEDAEWTLTLDCCGVQYLACNMCFDEFGNLVYAYPESVQCEKCETKLTPSLVLWSAL